MPTSDGGPGLRGRFWLQDATEVEAIPGRLFLESGSHPLLEVDGLLTPVVQETSRTKLPDGTEVVTSSPISSLELAAQSLVIHGVLESGKRVTLPSAFTAGWTERGFRHRSQRLKAFYALVGDQVNGADALFTGARIRIRHLDAWACLRGFTFTPAMDAAKYTLAFEEPEVPVATLANGARIALEQVIYLRGFDVVAGGKLEREVWLKVTDMPPATYRDSARTIVKPLMNLLTLCVSEECPVVALEVSAGPEDPWLTVHSAAMRPAAEEIVPLPRILLPRADIGMTGVATWLDTVVRLGPLPSVVGRAAASRDDPLETQLLELTTVTEGLHRLLLPQRERMTPGQASDARGKALEAVKDLGDDVREGVQAALGHLTDQSYPRRLLDLAEHAGPAVPGVTGDTAQWKKRVVSIRNRFAHSLEHGFLDEDNTNESAAVLGSLRWLLTGLLLLQTGIDTRTLSRRFMDHERYQLFLEQAQIWLPAVYGTSQSPR